MTSGNKIPRLGAFQISAIDMWRVLYGEWTTKPPTEPGLYRVQNKNGLTFWAYYSGRDYKFIQLFGTNARVFFSFITHWLGPLPEPEPLKETK